jgi:hypothetical protein
VEQAWLRGGVRKGFTMELDSLFRLGGDDAFFVAGREPGFPVAAPAVIVGVPPRQPGIVVEVLCGADTDGDLIAVAPGGRRN